MTLRYRFGVIVAALWWGSLTSLGCIVVPQLFIHLPSPAAAGAMAARLFTAQAWLGMACAMLLLMIFNRKEAADQTNHAQHAIKLIVAGLFLTLLVEFAVAPRIMHARAEGGNLKFWHALASAMYLGQWLCAGFALWRLVAQRGSLTSDTRDMQSHDGG
ncbi:MAG: hypothetical protein JWP47_626 [Polaromonas sp.]|jgi:hypothetical protein|nr:hypothetical protein [Polaromonas sp.]